MSYREGPMSILQFVLEMILTLCALGKHLIILLLTVKISQHIRKYLAAIKHITGYYRKRDMFLLAPYKRNSHSTVLCKSLSNTKRVRLSKARA